MNKSIEEEIGINLIKLKKENKDKYENILSVLEFLYHDIKENSLEKDIKYYDNIYRITKYIGKYEESNKLRILKKSIFNDFIEDNDGIIDSLFEMFNDEDSRFMNKFIETVEVPIDMLRRNIISNSSIYLYVFNIYTMLQAYKENKDDFDNYSAIVDDISLLFIPSATTNQSSESYNYGNKKTLLDKIIRISDYKDLKSIKNLLKNTLVNISMNTNEQDEQRLNEMFTLYREFYSDIRRFTKLGYNIPKELKLEIADDISLLVHNDLLSGVYPYYSSVLLLDNRYKYFKDKIKVVDLYYRKEVFDIIKKLSPGLFVTEDKETDLFKECMDVVFDSDTYKELLSKLEVLKEAHERYISGDNDTSSLLDNLNDLQHRDHFGKIIINYGSSNNKIDKPSTINKRMVYLYKKYDLVRKEFDFETKRETLNDLISQIDDEMLNYDINKNGLNISESSEGKAPLKKKSMFSIFDKR